MRKLSNFWLKYSCIALTCALTIICSYSVTFAQSVALPVTAAERTAIDDQNSEMRGLIERYTADLRDLHHVYTQRYSTARRDKLREFYRSWLALLPTLPFDRFSHAGQVDYLLLQNELQYQAQAVETDTQQLAEISALVPFAPSLWALEDARSTRQQAEGKATAVILTQAAKQIEATRKELEAKLTPETPADKGKNLVPGVGVKRTVANRAAQNVMRLRGTLTAWFRHQNGYDPLFSWWVSEPYRTLDKHLESYATFLRERLVGIKADDKTTIIGDPIGPEALAIELRHEMIPYTPAELVAIAEKEFAWCDAEMLKASRALGYGDDWRKAMEYVKTRYVDPGEQPALVRKLADEATEFVTQKDLLTVPQAARDSWRMEMMSPEAQLQNPFFLGGDDIIIAFPTDAMTQEAKMMSLRGNNRHFARATVHHELIPGHHLQAFMTARYRPYRQIFDTPFWTEGWALYWEMRLWDLNFPQSPEDRIGMLFWRMHRCARIIFSLNFHLGRMSPQECVDFLIQRVGHESDNAYAEVRRSFAGSYPPLYQAGYLLGGLQIRALHGELVTNGKMSERAFHDAIMQNNAMPIEMVRANLTNQKLPRDYTAQWKFYR